MWSSVTARLRNSVTPTLSYSHPRGDAVIHTPGVILVNPLPVVLVVLGRVASWDTLILDHLIHGTGVYKHHYHSGLRPLLLQVRILYLLAHTLMQRVFVSTWVHVL